MTARKNDRRIEPNGDHNGESTAATLLSCGDTYPDQPSTIERRETHISWLFFTRDHVYKLKKPVCFDFLDFRTVEARRIACNDELRLNRRLAKDVYLAVEPIVRDHNGVLSLGAGSADDLVEGETIIDWVVKMRRLPDDRSLDRMIRHDNLQEDEVKQLANSLAQFYQSLPPVVTRAKEYHGRIEQNVRDNREELMRPEHQLPQQLVMSIHAAQLTMLAISESVFDSRVCDGRIVEGHGDLRPEHVYFAGGPQIIDCIEFNRDLRCIDVVDELAFFQMECDALGASKVAARVLETYLAQSNDNPPAELLPFFQSYRACVRGKVALLRSAQVPEECRSVLRSEARRYIELAHQYSLQLGPPIVVIVRGSMGSGKSTLATSLAHRFGADLIQTDAIRREIFGVSSEKAALDQSNYRPEKRQQVYEQLFRRCEAQLESRLSLVLDGQFQKVELCDRAVDIIARAGAMPIVVNCHCPVDVSRARIAARIAQGETLSEARPDLLAGAHAPESLADATYSVVNVDTTLSVDGLVRLVIEEIHAASTHTTKRAPRSV